MIKIPVYNEEGKVIGQEKLDPEIFGLESKPDLIHQTVVSLMANQRHPFAHTKARSEVRGGGKKPWRQKGTGRARAGTIRSPLWKGGGVTFGPDKNRNYSQKINRKIKRQVLLMCLSDKVKEERLYVLDKLEMPEIKTKKFVQILFKLIPEYKDKASAKGGSASGGKSSTSSGHGKKATRVKIKPVLIVIDKKDEKITKSAKNIPALQTVVANNLNLIKLLNCKHLVITKNALEEIVKVYK